MQKPLVRVKSLCLGCKIIAVLVLDAMMTVYVRVWLCIISGLTGIPCDKEIRRKRHSSVNLDDELDAIERLKMNEKLIEELNEPWEEKLKKTAIIGQQRLVRVLERGCGERILNVCLLMLAVVSTCQYITIGRQLKFTMITLITFKPSHHCLCSDASFSGACHQSPHFCTGAL